MRSRRKGVGAYQNLADGKRFSLWKVSQRKRFFIYFFPMVVFPADASERVLFVCHFLLRGKMYFCDQVKSRKQDRVSAVLCLLYAVWQTSQDDCQWRIRLCDFLRGWFMGRRRCRCAHQALTFSSEMLHLCSRTFSSFFFLCICMFSMLATVVITAVLEGISHPQGL